LLDTYSMMVGHQELGVVTGKPVSIGGSVGREEATGRGVMNVLRSFLMTKNKQLTDVRGATVIAVSDKFAGVFDESGVDIEAAGAWVRENGELTDFPGGDAITNEE